MFDEDRPKPKAEHQFPRNLDGMSVSELDAYIQALKDEISRVEEDVRKKKASQDAAASVFKS